MPAREALAQFFRYFHPRRLLLWQWLILFVVGLLVAVRLWLPEFLRQQIIGRLTATTDAQIQLGDIALNFLRGRVALRHLSLTLSGEAQPIILIEDLAVNFRLRSLLHGQINLEDVRLSGLQLAAVRQADGHLNLNRLFPSSSAEPALPPSDRPTLVVQRLHLSRSQVTYSDLTFKPGTQFALKIGSLTTGEILLSPAGLRVPVSAQIDGSLEESPLHGTAQILWQRTQTEVELEVDTPRLAVTAVEPYLRNVLVLRQLSGYLGTHLRYRYHKGGDKPFSHILDGRLTLQQVQFADPVSDQTMLRLPTGQADLERIDLARRDIRLGVVELQNPELSLLRTPGGLNATSLLRTREPTTLRPPKEAVVSPWQFSLPVIKWTGGEIRYRENTWPEKEIVTLNPEEIQIENLGSGDTKHPFRVRARLGKGTVTGEGQVQSAPFALRARLQPSEVEVDVLQPLLVPLLVGRGLHGKVTGAVQTEISDKDGARVANVSGTLETTKFAIDELPGPGGSIGWEHGRVEISEGSAVAPLSLGLKTELSQFSLQRATHADLSVEKIDGDLRLTRPTTASEEQIVIISGSLDTVKLLLNKFPEPTNVLAWEQGHFELGEGSTVRPLLLNLAAQLSQFSAQHFPQGEVTIEKTTGNLQLAQEAGPGQEPRLRTQGSVEVSTFALTRQPEKQILLGCYHGRAKIAQGSFLMPLDMRLQDVALEYTYAQGLRTPSGQFQLFIPDPNSQGPASPPSENAPDAQQQPSPAPSTEAAIPVSVQIDHATITGGELYFEDRTVTPPQTVYWQDVKVDLNKFGYPLVPPAMFSAHAYNEEGAPIEFKGTTERRGGQTIVRVHGQAEKMSLSRFNAYLAPSLGYRVERGAVSVTWDLVLPGDRLQANMQVTLHDLGLGDKQNPSVLEQQVGLPLTLVIGLLKDLNGDISLQLPVAGRVGEPGFYWRGTILRAVRDVIIGAVMSPLKLLGAVFKGKDTLEGFTLEPIQFVPGTSQISDAGREQLVRLAQFLARRPELDLRLSGSVGPEETSLLKDRQILAQLPASPVPPETQNIPAGQQEKGSAPQATPQEEVRRFLTQELGQPGNTSVPPLSPQAAELLAQLRKQVVIPADAAARLAAERVQAVISGLTAFHAVPAARLHLNPEKQRGPGGPEVRYVIQTREEQSEEK